MTEYDGPSNFVNTDVIKRDWFVVLHKTDQRIRLWISGHVKSGILLSDITKANQFNLAYIFTDLSIVFSLSSEQTNQQTAILN